MKILEDMILERGIAVNEDILKVDSFVNHQVDPELMKNIGDEFAEHFKGQGITKVATIESAGAMPELSMVAVNLKASSRSALILPCLKKPRNACWACCGR